MLNSLAVGIGGFVGSILRYWVGQLPLRGKAVFPVNTLLINVAGAFVIGLVAGLFGRHSEWDGRVLLLLKVGFCGGFTTFSTFSSETLQLFETDHPVLGILYVCLSAALGVAAVFLGQQLAKCFG